MVFLAMGNFLFTFLQGHENSIRRCQMILWPLKGMSDDLVWQLRKERISQLFSINNKKHSREKQLQKDKKNI
jgi:hypothetical protein